MKPTSTTDAYIKRTVDTYDIREKDILQLLGIPMPLWYSAVITPAPPNNVGHLLTVKVTREEVSQKLGSWPQPPPLPGLSQSEVTRLRTCPVDQWFNASSKEDQSVLREMWASDLLYLEACGEGESYRLTAYGKLARWVFFPELGANP